MRNGAGKLISWLSLEDQEHLLSLYALEILNEFSRVLVRRQDFAGVFFFEVLIIPGNHGWNKWKVFLGNSHNQGITEGGFFAK